MSDAAPTDTDETYCYRHPTRETGRRCTRCNRYACTDCLIQASVGSHCVNCVKEGRPPTKERLRRWNNTQGPLITKILIGINVAVYLLTASGGVGGGSGSLERDLAVTGFDVNAGEWYRLVTSGFLHFGLLHIGFNMLMLYRLGGVLEEAVGRTRYALLFAAALLGGSFGALLLSPNALTGGASGAVFGIMGATAIGMRLRGASMQENGIAGLIGINLLLSIALPGISLGGHLGGLIGGSIVGAAMLRIPQDKQTRTISVAIAVAVIVAATLGSIAVAGR